MVLVYLSLKKVIYRYESYLINNYLQYENTSETLAKSHKKTWQISLCDIQKCLIWAYLPLEARWWTVCCS